MIVTANPALTVRSGHYRTIWRWHFYAALFVMPLVLFLALTGSIFLFKPQIDAWEEGRWQGAGSGGTAVSADDQVAAALLAVPGSSMRAYRLPRAAGSPAVMVVDLAATGEQREIFVRPDGRIAAVVDPAERVSAVVSALHGSLLAGTPGRLIVELAGSWAIVMILSGLYLWWPKGAGGKWRLAGVAWPRFAAGRRAFWRDLHAVTGFWVAGLALILLLTALPWTEVWASGFRIVRAEMGWVTRAPADWKGGAAVESHDHSDGHDHAAMVVSTAKGRIGYAAIVERAVSQGLPFPTLIVPPHAPQRFGPPNGNVWKLMSEAQNRPLNRSIDYDPDTGAEIARSGFADKHVIDRVVNYGIAWHEGQLFGWINQLIGLVTALGLMTMTVSGFVMWRRRKPAVALGAPMLPRRARNLRVAGAVLLVLAVILPLLGLSMAALWLLERGVLRRVPAVARWLGLQATE